MAEEQSKNEQNAAEEATLQPAATQDSAQPSASEPASDAQAPGAPQQASPDAQPVESMHLDLPVFHPGQSEGESPGISLLSDVELDVKIELGRAMMRIEEVLKLGIGSVVELDKLAGDPVDVIVNGRLVARGEVLVLNENFCVRISEIVADPEAAELLEV